MEKYKFYFIKTNKDGEAIEANRMDLERDFPGLSYLSCTGLELRGKPKNIYVENYAETSRARVYHPSDEAVADRRKVTREPTKVSLDVVIQGKARRATYDDLCAYLSGARLFYWDTARHKKAWLVLNEEINPVDDTLKGVKYIRVTLNFLNMWGRTYPCDDDGIIDVDPD